MKKRYYFTQLADKLEHHLQCDVGLQGVENLIHGFIQKGGMKRETLRTREKRDGEPWLNYYETVRFSDYAGYNLT